MSAEVCPDRLTRPAPLRGTADVFQRLRLMPPTQGDADCSFSGSGFRMVGKLECWNGRKVGIFKVGIFEVGILKVGILKVGL